MLKVFGLLGFVLVIAVLALDAVTPAVAQNWAIPDRGFRVEWEAVPAKRGPEIRGYVHNDLGYGAMNIRLLIESLDATGQVVATTVGYLLGTAPPFDRLYFEVSIKASASSYRVRVAAWEPFARGG